MGCGQFIPAARGDRKRYASVWIPGREANCLLIKQQPGLGHAHGDNANCRNLTTCREQGWRTSSKRASGEEDSESRCTIKRSQGNNSTARSIFSASLSEQLAMHENRPIAAQGRWSRARTVPSAMRRAAEVHGQRAHRSRESSVESSWSVQTARGFAGLVGLSRAPGESRYKLRAALGMVLIVGKGQGIQIGSQHAAGHGCRIRRRLLPPVSESQENATARPAPLESAICLASATRRSSSSTAPTTVGEWVLMMTCRNGLSGPMGSSVSTHRPLSNAAWPRSAADGCRSPALRSTASRAPRDPSQEWPMPGIAGFRPIAPAPRGHCRCGPLPGG